MSFILPRGHVEKDTAERFKGDILEKIHSNTLGFHRHITFDHVSTQEIHIEQESLFLVGFITDDVVNVRCWLRTGRPDKWFIDLLLQPVVDCFRQI